MLIASIIITVQDNATLDNPPSNLMTPYDPFISYPLIVAKYSTPKNKVFSLYYNASPFLWLYIILILNSKEYENLITFFKVPSYLSSTYVV